MAHFASPVPVARGRAHPTRARQKAVRLVTLALLLLWAAVAASRD